MMDAWVLMKTWVDVAGWTLVHFVWQGAVIAAGAAAGFYWLRHAAPNGRYLFATAALALMLISPVVTAYVISSPNVAPNPVAEASSHPVVFAPFAIQSGPRNTGTLARTSTETPLQRLPRAFPVIVVTWLTGVAMLLTRLLGGWWRVRELHRAALSAPLSRWQAATDRLARRLGVRRPVRVADAETVDTPTVIGWLRPVVLLPITALAGLTPSQADAILAHELAHIRRHDYLVNLLQHVAETVLFYHPALWWVSHRMRAERELCCDAIVVGLCADPVDYAAALTRLEEARRMQTELAVAATGGSLLERVRHLLSARTDRHTPTAHGFVTAAIIALVVVVVGGGYRWSSHALAARDLDDKAVTVSIQPPSVSPEPTQPAAVYQIQPTPGAKSRVPVAAAPVAATVAAGPVEPAQRVGADTASPMSLAVEVNYFQLNRAEYSVPISARIPGSELLLARSRGARRTTLDFVGEVKDAYDITVQNFRDKLDINLSDGFFAGGRPIQFETALTLLPGSYSLRIAARDEETDRIGTFQTTFVVPNLNRVEANVPISTVVLGNQLVPFNTGASGSVRPDPLVYGGLKLVPSVTRVFSRAQDLYVFLQAYQRDPNSTQPLMASVALYSGARKVLESPPTPMTDAPEARSRAIPVRLSVPLGSLTPGTYDCEVTVLDPAGQKVSAWRAPVVIIP